MDDGMDVKKAEDVFDETMAECDYNEITHFFLNIRACQLILENCFLTFSTKFLEPTFSCFKKQIYSLSTPHIV